MESLRFLKLINSLRGDQRQILSDVLDLSQKIFLLRLVEGAEKGESLHELLTDLRASLKPPQIKAVLAALDVEQLVLFREILDPTASTP